MRDDIFAGKRKMLGCLASICIFSLWLIMIWNRCGICFETNDDRFIAEILSGGMTGTPEAHAIYVNYLLAYPLSLLYRMAAQVPWYGALLVLLHLAAYAALLQSAWSKASTLSGGVVMTGLVCGYALMNFYMTASLQYTSTAALAAAAGYGCLLLQEDRARGLGLFFSFELAAFLLRSQAMLMILPLGGAAGTGLYLVSEGGIRETGKKLLYMILALCAVLAIGSAGTLIGYRGEGWRDFNRFNAARTTIFDYYSQPDYDEVEPILEKYDVTRAEYLAFCRFVITDWDVSADCVEELAAYVESTQRRSVKVMDMLRKQWEYLKASPAVGAAWWAALLWMILLRRFYMAVPLAGIAAGRLVAWCYLIYRGRLPARVTLPLLGCEAFLLLMLLAWDYLRGEKLPERKPYAFLLGLAWLICCFLTAEGQFSDVSWSNAAQRIYIEGLVEIRDYCSGHPDGRYLLDTWSLRFYNGSPFETRVYGENNYVYTGSWFSNSPAMRLRLQGYLTGQEEAIRLVVAEDGSGEENYAVAFLAEKLGREPLLVDRLALSNGEVYLVWRFAEAAQHIPLTTP